MKRSKRNFLLASLIFLIIIIWLAIDIGSRTEWPGKKSNTEESK